MSGQKNDSWTRGRVDTQYSTDDVYHLFDLCNHCHFVSIIQDRRRWEDFPPSSTSQGGGGGGVPSSGEVSRRRQASGQRMSEGVVPHSRDSRGVSGGHGIGGGGVSGPDSPLSTLRRGSQASEDLPWGSSPPSQSSEPIESSKTDLDGIAAKTYRGLVLLRDAEFLVAKCNALRGFVGSSVDTCVRYFSNKAIAISRVLSLEKM